MLVEERYAGEESKGCTIAITRTTSNDIVDIIDVNSAVNVWPQRVNGPLDCPRHSNEQV